jgi:hypothetical protein
MSDELIEQVAQIIYKTQGGASNEEEFEMMTGYKLRLWKTDAPWDTNPNELCEWERDDFRWQAEAVLKFLGKI